MQFTAVAKLIVSVVVSTRQYGSNYNVCAATLPIRAPGTCKQLVARELGAWYCGFQKQEAPMTAYDNP